MKDLQHRQDIETVVRAFYERALTDEVLGPYFAAHPHFDLERHLPRMYDYWENVLFHNGGYTGNPLATHVKMNHFQALSEPLFLRWLDLFHSTISANFAGENAEQLKLRARNIGYIMQSHVLSAPPSAGVYEAMLDVAREVPRVGTAD
jgi:hemoglobin